jgi:hypothetical protein
MSNFGKELITSMKQVATHARGARYAASAASSNTSLPLLLESKSER